MRAPTLVLMYHRVGPGDANPLGLLVSPLHFAEQLAIVAEKAELIPLDHVLTEGSTPRVAITFDDGYVDNLTQAAPILERAGCPATVFVTAGMVDQGVGFWQDRLASLLLTDEVAVEHASLTIGGVERTAHVGSSAARQRAFRYFHHHLRRQARSSIEQAVALLGDQLGLVAMAPPDARPLTRDELRSLDATPGISIGAHTMTHTMLSSLGAQDQEWEMLESRRTLEAILNAPVRTFAYPFGSPEALNEDSVRLARSIFDLSLVSEGGSLSTLVDSARVPRQYVGDWPTPRFEQMLDTWLAAS